MMYQTCMYIDQLGIGSNDEEGVRVPPLDFELSDGHLEELQGLVDPLSDSDDFRIDLYMQTLDFIESVL